MSETKRCHLRIDYHATLAALNMRRLSLSSSKALAKEENKIVIAASEDNKYDYLYPQLRRHTLSELSTMAYFGSSFRCGDFEEVIIDGIKHECDGVFFDKLADQYVWVIKLGREDEC